MRLYDLGIAVVKVNSSREEATELFAMILEYYFYSELSRVVHKQTKAYLNIEIKEKFLNRAAKK